MTVVVGYRPDEFGEVALEHAIARARAARTSLVVVNVAKRGVDSQELDASKGFVRGHELEQLRYRLVEALGGTNMEIRQPVGTDTADEILGVVAAEDADLLVIGLRPRSPVGKFLMGSTAQTILIDSTVPVLAVKPGQVPLPVL
jgi:nucleotide-binding universal stress UspA family protein